MPAGRTQVSRVCGVEGLRTTSVQERPPVKVMLAPAGRRSTSGRGAERGPKLAPVMLRRTPPTVGRPSPPGTAGTMLVTDGSSYPAWIGVASWSAALASKKKPAGTRSRPAPVPAGMVMRRTVCAGFVSTTSESPT
jgi:hypothetical protein